MGLNLRRFAGLLTLAALLAGSWTAPLHSADKGRSANAVLQSAEQSEDSRLLALLRTDRRRLAEIDPLATLFGRGDPDASGFKRIFTDELDRDGLALVRQALDELREIDRARLSPERQLSYDTFLREKQEAQTWLSPPLRALTAVRPISHYGGLHVEFASAIARGGGSPYRREEDYLRSVALLRAFPVVTDNIIRRFRQGMASGVVDTQLTVRNMLAQIDSILAQPQEQSPFYAPVTRFPDYVPLARRKQLQAAYADALKQNILPAYRKLRNFLAEEYLPRARAEVGLSAMPGGSELYARMIERETTQKLDPEDVHQLGLSEVARIRSAMEGVARQLGFRGTLPAFFEHMRSDPRYHPRSAQELADGYAAVARKVDALIPKYFTRVPRTRAANPALPGIPRTVRGRGKL